MIIHRQSSRRVWFFVIIAVATWSQAQLRLVADTCRGSSAKSGISADGHWRVNLRHKKGFAGIPSFAFEGHEPDLGWQPIQSARLFNRRRHYHLQTQVANHGRGFVIMDRAGGGSIRFFDQTGTETVSYKIGQFSHLGIYRSVSHAGGLTVDFAQNGIFVKILGRMIMSSDFPGFETTGETQTVLTFPAGRILSIAEPPDVMLLLAPQPSNSGVESVRPLIANLHDKAYDVRCRAERRLAALGPRVVPLVKRFLKDDPPLEASIHGRNVLLAVERVELARRDGLDHDLAFLISLLDHAPPPICALARRRLQEITVKIRPDDSEQTDQNDEWIEWLEGLDTDDLQWDAEREQFGIRVEVSQSK